MVFPDMSQHMILSRPIFLAAKRAAQCLSHNTMPRLCVAQHVALFCCSLVAPVEGTEDGANMFAYMLSFGRVLAVCCEN